MAIYLDGTLVKEIEYDAQKRDIRTSNGALIFGMGGGTDGLHPLNGGLDDIRIYNRALSESEIKELYKAE